MIIQENDFLRAYNEMTSLWEDLNTTVDLDRLDPTSLSGGAWDNIKEASMALCKRFHRDVIDWPYQFQLQYNSYRAECLALEKLKDPVVVKEINKMLESYGESRRLKGAYQFNPYPCAHNILGVNAQPIGISTSEDSNESVVDIIPADDLGTRDDRITKIEVKCKAGSKTRPKGFHKCQLVFVFDIAEDSCTVYYFKGKCQTKTIYKIDGVGIQGQCISVDPRIDISAREATEITCHPWTPALART